MTIVEFEKALAKGKVPPVVLLVGEEGRLVDRGLNRLREAVVPEAQRAFHEERLHGGELDPARLVDGLRTLPLLGGRRLVVVREAERLAPDVLDALAAYAEAPLDSAVLVLAAERIDRRLKVWKVLEAAGVLVDCGHPDEHSLSKRLEEMAEAAGVAFEPGAAEVLIELAGNDLGVLEGEVAKLAAFVGPGRRVGPEAVHEVVAARGGDHSVFAWVDAVAERRAAAALVDLGRLLAAGEEPLRLLALLARQVRLIWGAKALAARGASAREVAEHLVPRARFLAPKLLAQARGFSEAELAAIHDGLVEADLALKSSPASERLVLERLVLAICRPRRPPRTGGDRGRGSRG
jgi:DNA polymerase-3 subunit delta